MRYNNILFRIITKMLDFIGKGLDSAVKGGGDMYKGANDAVRNWHKANTNREPIPPRSGQFNADNKYSTAQYSYPSDLMSEVYGGNYAIFYINVAVESRLNVKENTVELNPLTEKRMRGSLVAKNMSTLQLVGATAGVNVLGSVGGGIAKRYSGSTGASKDPIMDSKAKFDASAGALGVAVAGTMAPDASRSQRRLKTAIALHIPNQLSVRYGMQWSEEDTADVQAVADGIQAALNKQGAKNKMVGVGSVALEAGAGIALQKAGGAASAALGIAANPKKEQTFKGVDFRKFTFDYQFFPRTEEEAANVIRIINEFKIHMHPEFKSELNYVYIYPSEFDITYYASGVENENLHRHTSCVLEEMNVNYTPNGSYNTFPNGMPTQINMTLGFKELQLLSRETVMGGL